MKQYAFDGLTNNEASSIFYLKNATYFIVTIANFFCQKIYKIETHTNSSPSPIPICMIQPFSKNVDHHIAYDSEIINIKPATFHSKPVRKSFIPPVVFFYSPFLVKCICACKFHPYSNTCIKIGYFPEQSWCKLFSVVRFSRVTFTFSQTIIFWMFPFNALILWVFWSYVYINFPNAESSIFALMF